MSALDKFGKFMVTNFREKALEQNEMLLKGFLKGKAVQDLQNQIMALPESEKRLIRRVVIDLLDTAMHDFLFALQDSHDRGTGIEITVDGENVAKVSGMLHGEHLGEKGWIT